MANLSFTYDQQIIRDLYNTADEAIAASRSLGCDGYRTYLINGETKYVPCSSYVQYENALRWKKAQGAIGAFGNDTFGNKLVGLQFANSKDEIQGDPYFTMGNFSISTSTKISSPTPSVESVGNDPVGSYTINDIADRNLSYFSGKPYVETTQQLVDKNLSVKVLFDRKKLDNHVLYSSLKERIKTSLMEIYNQFPAAMRSNAVSIYKPNISSYAYIANENRSQFKVSLFGLANPFGINYLSTGTTSTDNENITVYRNFAKQYSNYVIYFNGVEYPIVNATLPTTTDANAGITVVVNGNPFGNLVNINSETNNSFYIKPKQAIYDEFFDGLSDFASFLLSYDSATNQYKSDFVFPTLSDNGVIVETKETVYFPKLDDVNIDMFTDSFEAYTVKLNDLAESYDAVKTNLIARFLTTDSLKEFDTEDRKVNLIFQLYGKQFDEIRKYIDGITFMRNVSYDKIENVPDLLLKNFAHMLGFETYELEDENTLIESLFTTSVSSSTMTPAEVDIEIWRRILINAAYLFKSKGTRKSIEFILKLVGFPDDVFELNEYVYLAERPLNVSDVLNKIYVNSTDDPEVLLNLQPFDNQGYPTTPYNTHYQGNGGSAIEDKFNYGPYDFGKAYITAFKKSGSVHLFELERTVDDRKSWMIVTSTTQLVNDENNGYTDYYSDNTKLTINSKEFEVYIGSDRILDVSIYRQYVRNLGMINADLTFNNPLSFDAADMSFNEFVKQSVNNFINPTNRKVISTYPTLTKIYLDYYSGTTNPMDISRSLAFLGQFDTHWVKLIQQFIPATTIYNAGKKIQNSAFNDNKFKYKHGLNTTVNWLGTDGSEFQELALRPVYMGTNKVLPNEGVITESIDGSIPSYTFTAKQGDKVYGELSGNERYLGSFYSISDFCDESEGRYEIWASGVNYGDDTIYSGNTNTAGPKYGVFVVYNDNVYRLNTKALFNWGSYSGITTTGGTRGLPPNAATDTYSGVTKYLWDHIDYNTDSRTVSFQDSTGITGSERSFYMNSIGAAQAFIQIGLTYDCPPPKPHVCYFDFTGRTVNLTGYTGTTLLSYTDNTGALLYIKQPKYFGYSKDRSATKPTGTSRGYISNWTTDYEQIFNYTSGQTYYYGEYVGMIDPSDTSKLVGTLASLGDSKLYRVTGDTMYAPDNFMSLITGVTWVSDIGTDGLPTTTTGITGGLYGRYEERTTTDPFMQVDTAYIDKIVLDPVANKASFNLTKSLNLVHVFSGTTPATTYRVNDTVVGDQLYVSNSIGLTFEGLYPVNPAYVGPFYTPKEDSVFIHTLQDTLTLALNTNNAVSIQSLNDNFNSVGTDLTLIKTNPGYYLVTKSSFLTINIKLYFESQSNIAQTVRIQLLNTNQVLYDEQTFTFNGDDLPDDRQFEYTYQDFFKAGDKIYLNLIPITVPCTLSRYEKIEYLHSDPDVEDPLNDPRFRVLFNSGNVFNKFGYRTEGLSIKPIYNLADLTFNELKLNYGSGKYNVLTTPNITYSLDPSYLMNKMYLDYYKKFTTGTLEYNTKEFDKPLGNDKIDFTFTIRSKTYDYSGEITASSGTTSATGVNGRPISYDFSYFDYYLGNTPKQTEFSNITNTISIGKNVSRRLLNHNRAVNYIPQNTYLNGVALGTESTIKTKTFISYDSGLVDYPQLNYSTNILNQIRTNRRYYTGIFNTTGATIFQYYAKENYVYSTELYQDILAKVPEFNEQIINYELNDIVKVAIEDYKLVSGNTVVTQTKYKLYVCVNEIHPSHCYSTTGTTGSIHPIYRPRGSRSCFIELERYNPANFTPWGYEESMVNGYPTPNVIDYVYRNIISFDTTLPMNYSFGDLILATYSGANEFFRYIYNKSTTYEPTRVYSRGEFVTSGVTEGSSTVYRYFFAKTTVPSGTPVSNTTYWTKLTNELFDHRSLAASGETGTMLGSSGVTIAPLVLISTWAVLYSDESNIYNFSSTAARLPKTLPVTDNRPFIATGSVSGYTSESSRWNNVLLPNHIFIDRTYDILDNYEIITQNKILNNNGYFTDTIYGKGYYTGPNMGMTTGDIDTEGTNYTDLYGISRNGVSNIYLKPSAPYNPIKIAPGTGSTSFNTRSYYLRPYQGEAIGLMPLFERLCREEERNNPGLFVSPNLITFDGSSLFHAKKYSVSRGSLYKYVNPTPVAVASGVTEPALDTTNWEERDFCLVNNFTYYKDRTRVEVFESTIETLTTAVKNDLYFYNSALNLKTGFTSKSFSGATTNAKLVTALNKFYDVTDENRRIVTQYGEFDFRLNGTDIIMDYYYPKDQVGYPVTGEFIGKLTATNACGHQASTIFGMLFNTSLNKLNRGATLATTGLIAAEAEIQNTYTVRLIINQSSNATANLSVLRADSNLQPVTQNYVVNKYTTYDNKFSVIPQTDLQVTLSYSTAKKQTMFKSGTIDNLSIFVNDVLTNTAFVQTSITTENNVETRVITLKNVSTNSTINITLAGVENISVNTVETKNVFNVKNINIKTTQL